MDLELSLIMYDLPKTPILEKPFDGESPIVKFPELSWALLEEVVFDTKPRRTTYFMTYLKSIHTNDIFTRPQEEKYGQECFNVRYQDKRGIRNPGNKSNGDFSVEFDYFPDSENFQVIGIGKELTVKNSTAFVDYESKVEEMNGWCQYIKNIVNSNQQDFNNLRNTSNYNDLFLKICYYFPDVDLSKVALESFEKAYNIKHLRRNVFGAYNFLQLAPLEDVVKYLNPYLTLFENEIQSQESPVNISIKHLTVVRSGIKNALNRIVGGDCIKNPTQQEVINIRQKLRQ